AAYERFVQPLTADGRERYYEDMNVVARLFGTPAVALPHSYDTFRTCFETQPQSGTLTVTRPARQVAGVLLAAAPPAALRPPAPPVNPDCYPLCAATSGCRSRRGRTPREGAPYLRLRVIHVAGPHPRAR